MSSYLVSKLPSVSNLAPDKISWSLDSRGRERHLSGPNFLVNLNRSCEVAHLTNAF